MSSFYIKSGIFVFSDKSLTFSGLNHGQADIIENKAVKATMRYLMIRIIFRR